MTAVSVGHLASQALPAVSPWIIPVIAVAAKRTYERSRDALRGRPAPRADDASKATPDLERSGSAPLAMHERFRTRREAPPWPD